MSKIIDDYIYAVIKNLPKESRADIEAELYVTIEDMLAGDSSDENIEKVLMELGRPDILALEYKQKPSFLISPLYFNEYILYLKFALIVAGTFATVLSCLIYLINSANEEIYLKVAKTIGIGLGSMIAGFVIAFTLVTIAFALADKLDKRHDNAWKINHLPKKPSSEKLRIGRKKALTHIGITMVIGIIGTILVLFYTKKIGYIASDGTLYPLINRGLALIYIPLFFISLALNIVLTYYAIKDGAITYRVAILDTIYKMFAAVSLLAFILQPQIINKVFIEQIAHNNIDNIRAIELSIQISVITVSVLVATIVALSVGKKWYLLAKYK